MRTSVRGEEAGGPEDGGKEVERWCLPGRGDVGQADECAVIGEEGNPGAPGPVAKVAERGDNNDDDDAGSTEEKKEPRVPPQREVGEAVGEIGRVVSW